MMDGALLPVLAAAYGADLVFGDPRWLPHPVRGLGLVIQVGERLLRRLLRWEHFAGVALVAIVVAGSYGVTVWGLSATQSVPACHFALAAFLLYSCLSTRDLDVESRAVLKALEQGDLALARQRVARIVGRDTERLDEPEVVRATVETIAESTMDGIVSPLFYAALGGVPLAVAYKAVNTLDSMVGYRSARYLKFGAAAAKLDTVVNWLPARLTAWLILLAAPLKKGARHHFWKPPRKGARHLSNSEITESAIAGALGVRLGGVNWYQARPISRPYLGERERPLTSERIREAIRLMYVVSVLAWLAAMGYVAYVQR